MSTFAIVCNFQGDYGMKLLMVNPEDSMQDVARIAKENIAGIFVPELQPGEQVRVRRHGTHEFLPEGLTVSAAEFVQGETLDFLIVRPN